MYGQTTTTTNLFLDEDDRTQFLTLEQRLRYLEGSNLPSKPEQNQPSSRLRRLLDRFRR